MSRTSLERALAERVLASTYHDLVADARDAFFVVTADARLVEINQAGVDLFGYASRDEMVGMEITDEHVDPLDRACLQEVLALDGVVRDVEARIRRRGGEWLTVLVRARAVAGPDGAVIGFGGNLRDVSRERRAAVALKEAESRAQQAEKLRALGQMAGGIAHDLNQALGLVVGHGELALRHLDPPRHWPGASLPGGPDGARDSLRVPIKAAMDGAETVKRLLAFSRAGSEDEPELIQVSHLLDEVAKLTAPHWRDAAQAEGRPIVMRVESDEDVAVAGSPASLREAIANLIFNAVDALPRGGTIALRGRRTGENATIEVVDDGQGMTPEVQARVFEPFFTTKGPRGTGLGLAVVREIVERHGGSIAVASRTHDGDSGSTVTIVLPTASRDRFRPAETTVAASFEGARLRILAVDDEPDLRDMMALMLGNDGHTVRVAGSAQEALVALSETRYDLIISDVGMPGTNGWDLAAEVRRRWPDLRIVLATGWGAEIDPTVARRRGIAAVIAKPFRHNDLQRAIEGADGAA